MNAQWEEAVLARAGGVCANCGGAEKVKPRMIVPEAAGGKLVPSNGAVLCRPCGMALDASSEGRGSPQRRPVNFWVSTPLYERLMNLKGFGSVSGLARYMMRNYVSDPAAYEDITLYQDSGTDTKMNIWVDSHTYEVFKGMVRYDGRTVTSTLKALLQMYVSEADHKIQGRS